ncbi:hypothetical protein FGL01_15550 [Flavobacterium glycines]|uniref:Uncharacterized protein n=1 Tax=Flavobacterium glycines TaxID=551990 RepID=A0A511CDR9_9FLAO|nr:hypothetical protein FGL01_15550 [Flavobacterium glycines]
MSIFNFSNLYVQPKTSILHYPVFYIYIKKIEIKYTYYNLLTTILNLKKLLYLLGMTTLFYPFKKRTHTYILN